MIAPEAVATATRCIRGPERLDDLTALEESHGDAELRVCSAGPRRHQATVPGITAVPAVA